MNKNHKKWELLLILGAKILLILGLFLIILQYIITFTYLDEKINMLLNEAIDSKNMPWQVVDEFNNITKIFPMIVFAILFFFLFIWITTIFSLIFINKKGVVVYLPFILIFFTILKLILLIILTFNNNIIAYDLNFFVKSHDWDIKLDPNIFEKILAFNYNDIINIISIFIILLACIIFIWFFSYKNYDYSYKFLKLEKKEFKYFKVNHHELYLFKL